MSSQQSDGSSSASTITSETIKEILQFGACPSPSKSFTRDDADDEQVGVMPANEEEILRYNRVKLFTFEPGSVVWREKGSGVIDVIGHRANKTGCRIIVESEPDRKVVCNSKITPEMVLTLNSSRSWTWVTIDSSGMEPTPETMVLFFSSIDGANRFKEAFESCQSTLLHDESDEIQDSVVANSQSVRTIFERRCLLRSLENEADPEFNIEAWPLVGFVSLKIFLDQQNRCFHIFVQMVEGGNESLLCDSVTEINVDVVLKNKIVGKSPCRLLIPVFHFSKMIGNQCLWIANFPSTKKDSSRRLFFSSFESMDAALEFQSTVSSFKSLW